MGYFPFTNYYFQMGVTVMGFAEDFGHKFPVNTNFETIVSFVTINIFFVK